MRLRVNKYTLAYPASILMVLLVVGCSTIEKKAAQPEYSAEITELLSGQALMGHKVKADELPNIDLFAITPEMAAFAENAVAHSSDIFDKVKALHNALLLPVDDGGRGILYSAFTTEAPIKTFNEHKANCLSFSLLYVALARHLDLHAYINEVAVPPTWDMRASGLLYYMQHVNVKIPLPRNINKAYFTLTPDDAVIDLEMNLYKSTYPQKTISDDVILAKFYSNRGMEYAAEGEYDKAFLYLRKALQENDQQSAIWNNFASLYRRKELFHETEIIYLQGLKLNPDDLTIMNNLSGVYHKMGNKKQALIYNNLAKHYRQANPYYQYLLAHSAYDSGDYKEALVYVKRAIEREKKEPRFYQLTANIYEKLGELKAGEAMNKKYQALLTREH